MGSSISERERDYKRDGIESGEHDRVSAGENGVNGGESMILQMKTTQAELTEMGADEIIDNLVEKLKELLLTLENFGSSQMAWLDKVFPPETRKERIQHWILVGAPYVLPGLVLLFMFWLCSRGKGVKMMKASGRNFLMPRTVFEANPKGYFQCLRADILKF